MSRPNKTPSQNNMMMTMTNFRYSGYVYDAVWLYARVLDALIRKDKSLVQVKKEKIYIFT